MYVNACHLASARVKLMQRAHARRVNERCADTVCRCRRACTQDMVAKYIISEKEKFGREVDQATAEAEVDAWLLKQATFAPSQTSTADIAIAGAVFVAAFASGIYFAGK